MPRDPFTVTELDGPRFELAMQLLRQGQRVRFVDLDLRVYEREVLVVAVQSTWRSENVTAESARADLLNAEKQLRVLLDGSPVLRSALPSEVRFELEDDYGMGSVLVCTLQQGQLRWAPGFPTRR
jgi:hypothetical protein